MSTLLRYISSLLLLLMLSWGLPGIVAAETDTQGKIEKIKAERQRLAKVRSQLEGQMGDIGRELRKLDSGLISARKATGAARKQVKEADIRLARLNRERDQLQSRIKQLKKQMLDESAAAWQRSSRASEWMGIFTGVPVSDIPHRRYLLNRVMNSQEQDRLAYLQSVQDLERVEVELLEERERLDALRREKQKSEQELAGRVHDKRAMLDRIRGDVVSKKKRDQQLAREEKALLRLLDNMSEGLLATDKSALEQKIRKRKGHLKWPVTGKIVASFGSRPSPSMPELQGVQLRPNSSAHGVKAMASGQVRYADWFGGFGLMTIIDYGDGILGVYAHNDVLYKQLGDWVEENETIAEAGSTGWINSVAVYFEIRDRGKAVNPKGWCRR
ncbi:Septal ring factor EnvC, activator of murein hydrolases AmiA and AmiB [Mariprofundus ferrinatatus]|uniref:Septal ring factor EnvC, activator of murein hydrolases AmiA and AmiB n=1 Tax=Mariprofundus ferrinatatus TaxID=1921087 RepID=A0A2K8L6U0_9PROT|nr:peptidoglycan DD-metalloendopeptidase family protein [Mariprofundus ferrinatatus]ATX83045.1 Septal ring factor EnvC, activator of murein hydrolases AmiA and AmiB [Mariprofundus ferrinatatus]